MEDPAGFLLRGLMLVFSREGFYGVTAAQAGIQNSKAFDKTGLLPRAGMTRKTGLLPRAGMTRYTIRLKYYLFPKNRKRVRTL